MTEMTSESSEEEPGDQESEDERNLEAVVVAKLGAPKKATTDLYRHGLTGKLWKCHPRQVSLWTSDQCRHDQA